MNTVAILNLIATYGPSVVPLIQQCIQWIEQGKHTVTSDDLAQLAAFASKSSSDFLKQAGVQIVDGKVVPITPSAPTPTPVVVTGATHNPPTV